MTYTKAATRAHNAALHKPWDRRIKIGHLHAQHKRGEITLFQLCESVARLVASVKNRYDEDSDEHWELDEIEGYFIWDQESFDEQNVDIVDYDSWIEALYDWADVDKRLWIDCGE